MTTSIGGQSSDTIERWVLDAEQYKNELQNVAKLIRAAQKDEKDLATVREALGKKTEEATKQVAKLNSTLGTKISAISWNQGLELLGKLKSAVGKVEEQTEKWYRMTDDQSAAIHRMSAAVGGLVSPMELLRANTRFTMGDMQLTERQMIAVEKAAVTLGRAMKTNTADAFLKLTDSIIGGRGLERNLRLTGVSFNLVGDEGQKAAQALQVLEERFGNVSVGAKKSSERMEALKTQVSLLWGEMVRATKHSDIWKTALRGLGDITEWLTGGLRAAKSELGLLDPAGRQWLRTLAGISRSMNTTFSSTVGKYDPVAKYLEDTAALGDQLAADPALMDAAQRAKRGSMSRERAVVDDFTTLGLGPTSWGGAKKRGGRGGKRKLSQSEAEALALYEVGVEDDKRENARLVAGDNYGWNQESGSWEYNRGAKQSLKDEEDYRDSRMRARLELEKQAISEQGAPAALQHRIEGYRREREGARSQGLWNAEEQQGFWSGTMRGGGKTNAFGLGTGVMGSGAMNKFMTEAEKTPERMQQATSAVKDFDSQLTQLASGSLTNAYSGLLNLADAAMQGKGNLGEMAVAFLKGTAMGLSADLFGKGVASQIEASAWAMTPWTAWMAPFAQARAGLFFAGAAAFGAGGLMLSGIQSAVGGGGGGAGSAGGGPATGDASRRAGDSSYRPSFGKEEKPDTRPLVVNVFMGDEGDLGAIPYMRRQIKTQLSS